MQVTLKRIRSDDTGTWGHLWMGNDILCFTAELPWKNNQHGISCISVGVYQVIPHSSDAHPNVWEVTGVPDRTGILIHEGNLPLKDSLGCIIVGDEFGQIGGQPAVINSRITIMALRGELPDRFTLNVIEA